MNGYAKVLGIVLMALIITTTAHAQTYREVLCGSTNITYSPLGTGQTNGGATYTSAWQCLRQATDDCYLAASSWFIQQVMTNQCATQCTNTYGKYCNLVILGKAVTDCELRGAPPGPLWSALGNAVSGLSGNGATCSVGNSSFLLTQPGNLLTCLIHGTTQQPCDCYRYERVPDEQE